jgi:uncharacterized protein YchJ
MPPKAYRSRSDVFAEEEAPWLCNTHHPDCPRDTYRPEALTSVHKDLRLCDLCKELAFGTQRAGR